jgi:sugar O-acyltransferase (sialic acid O-acetyltransferase NeuD family)
VPLPHRAFPLFPDCRRILIVGGGGFGREVRCWVRDAWPAEDALFAGFLDGDASRAGVAGPVLGDPDTYQPMPGDGLLLGVGIPGVRRRLAETLSARGGRFLALVHPTAIVVPSAVVGEGTIVCPHGVVSDAASLGRGVLVNYHASVAHDASVGDFCVLAPYATLGGFAAVGADVFLGLHASVGPGRRVGDRSKVSANSCALADVPPDTLVYGVPGRHGPLLS